MNKSVLDSVPFFYKKLFLGDHAAPLQIENRETEIEQAQKAIQLLNKKSGGSLLIIGEQLSGKKYFSDYVSSRLLKRKVIAIDPTIENKLIGKSFEKSISNVFQNELSLEENLKDSSAVTLVFNDIDKWGTDIKILETIKDLIIEFGKKHHFILNCSVDFYSYLKQVCDIDEVIISTIIILPIRKDGFIETMKLKHQAGGIKFSLNNKKENDFSFSQLQSFYQKYHSVYKGNLGRAFLGWVNNIQSVEEGLIYIKEPKSTFFPDISNPDLINEMSFQYCYMGMMLSPIFDCFKPFAPVYQIMTSDSFRYHMLKHKREIRTDDFYFHILKNMNPNLSNVPWARTGVSFGSTSDNSSDKYSSVYYEYPSFMRSLFSSKIIMNLQNVNFLTKVYYYMLFSFWSFFETKKVTFFDEFFSILFVLSELSKENNDFTITKDHLKVTNPLTPFIYIIIKWLKEKL
jgi:hypothetical protein